MANPAYLNLSMKATAFNDLNGANNPNRKYFDWGRSFQGLPALTPKTNSYTIPAGASQLIFSGTTTTGVDNTTQFTLSSSTLATDRYRFTATAGSLPVLRTDRGLTPNGHTYTAVANQNGTLSFTSSVTGEFSNVSVGDSVWLPGSTTGDTAGPFSPLNEGLWSVMSLDGTSTTLQLVRLGDFSGATETVAVTSNTQLVVFSSAGVQIGDKVDISAGFASAVCQTYQIVMVTPTWFEVITNTPIPVYQVAIPGSSGIVFYSTAKKLVGVETDQEIAVQRNGDTTTQGRVSPVVAGDPENTGFSWVWGATWSLAIVNRSSVPCNVIVLSAE